MMIFIIGGAYQGKAKFAKSFGLPMITQLQYKIRELLLQGVEARTEIFKQIGEGDWVVTCDEVGSGIIPIDKFERDYRELVGRIACEMAKKADEVYYVEAGIPQKIK